LLILHIIRGVVTLNNVLFIDADGGWGGASKSLLTLVRYLDRDAFRPILLMGMLGPVVDEYRKRGVSLFLEPFSCFVYSLSNRGFIIKKITLMILMIPKAIRTLRRIMKLEEIDLIHVNSIIILPTAFLCKLLFRVPIIFHVREMLVENVIGRLQRWLIYRIGDGIITPSENEARQFQGDGKRDKIVIRYNPVDLQEFQLGSQERERIRAELRVDQETIVISTVAVIIPAKGQDRIIDVARKIKQQYNGKCKFLIVGKIDIPEEKKGLRRLVRFFLGKKPVQQFQQVLEEGIITYALGEYIEIIEHRRDIWRILSASDIVLRTSRLNDPWGRDIIESMVIGRPIVATGTYDGFLENGKNGFLIPPQQTEEETIGRMVEKLLVLIHNKELRELMGENNMLKGSMLFDAKKYALSMQEIYDGVLHKKMNLLS